MREFDQISIMKKVFEIKFIKESLYSFLPTKKTYSDLITINNGNDFISLSNSDIFIIPIFRSDKKYIEKVKDELNYVFHREKYIVSFLELEFENIIHIDIDKLIEHSEKNGACKRNVFTLILKELICKNKICA